MGSPANVAADIASGERFVLRSRPGGPRQLREVNLD